MVLLSYGQEGISVAGRTVRTEVVEHCGYAWVGET